jgi:hypothetical protein
MAYLMEIGAVVIAFLLGGLAVAEYFCRRDNARKSMRWSDDQPRPPRGSEDQRGYGQD